MRDAIPIDNAANAGTTGEPASPNPGVLAAASNDGDLSPLVARAKDSAAERGAPTGDTTFQHGLFDLKQALKSAVRVLTKERSIARSVQALSETESGTQPAREAEPAAPASPEPRPAGLSGHTSTVAMPEVLGFLAQLRKSGTLWIWNDSEKYRVQLVDGNVTFARNETPHQGSRLGEILVSQGAIDAGRFEEFMKQPREPGPLGDALLKAGLVDRRALSNAVKHQAQCVFHRAYGLQDSYFCFDANRGHDAGQEIQISVTQMLFESARERDESERDLSSAFDDSPGK